MAVVLSVFLLVTLSASAQAPLAADTIDLSRKTYDIPAQNLVSALQKFIALSGLQIIYPSKILEGKMSEGLHGRYSPEEALKALIKVHGIQYEFVGAKALVLRKQPRSEGAKADVDSASSVRKNTGMKYIETVAVTGSRVPRPEFDYLYPTFTVDSAYFFQTNAVDIGTTIESLPVVCDGVYSTAGGDLERNIGATFPDLYCLGSQRTLTLVNGHRMVSTNEVSIIGAEEGSQFDINAIPNIMIDRVEVVGVGGAPVYGADAIAGTVNIILKEHYEGLQLDFSSGLSQREDGKQITARMLAGTNFLHDRGNIAVGYEHHDQDAVQASDRAYTAGDFDYFFGDLELEFFANITDLAINP